VGFGGSEKTGVLVGGVENRDEFDGIVRGLETKLPMKLRDTRFKKAGPWSAVRLALALVGVGCGVRAEVVVGGLSGAQMEAKERGQVLIGELNCVACHGEAGAAEALKARSKVAPRLAGLGSRVDPRYVEAYLKDVHGVKPGTTMPDVMAGLAPGEKTKRAKALTHFLLSLGEQTFAPEAPDAVAAVEGKRLFHARGCAACHAPRDDAGKELPMAGAVPLGALERKYSFRSLVGFLRDPHAVRPSGRMPELAMDGRDVERIAHFLLKDTRVPGGLVYTLYRGKVWEGLASDEVKPERGGQVGDFGLKSVGEVRHHTAIRYEGWLTVATPGKYTFRLVMNGGSLLVDGASLVEVGPSDRRGVRELSGTVELKAGGHRVELTYFHTGHEPKFSCEIEGPGMELQPVPGAMLSATEKPVPAFEPLVVDPVLAMRGRELFGESGCANCHDDVGVEGKRRASLKGLAAGRGCLGDGTGAWPKFDLSAEQREWIVAALPEAEDVTFSDEQRVNQTMVSLNCLACHERSGLGSLSAERRAMFTGTQPSLGDQGRVPPPLSHVGAKLTPEWLREVLVNGKRQRPYLDAVMPKFGERNVGHLATLFGKVDRLEDAVIPKVSNLQESKAAGYEMMGVSGFGCIVCHEYNGQKTGELAALDLVNVTSRLQKNWFGLYMRQPTRFHPTVIMPSYWPDGVTTRPNILGGDTSQQIEALWAYLEDGGKAKKPMGLSRQSNELRVSDVTELCRGQSPIGYRGIAVGYPERISLAFDSGEMALRQIWKGEFASVDAGHFHPRGGDQVSFPPGIPFHRLGSMDESWPYKGKTNYGFPQDQGYQFRGYQLDKARRPEFFYEYGGVKVRDFFEDVKDGEGKAYFRRTMTFETAAAAEPFYFRAAAGETAVAEGEREFKVGKLSLRVTSEHGGVVREGSPAEVLLMMKLPAGRTTLTLEYRW
jgi:cytochrome c553